MQLETCSESFDKKKTKHLENTSTKLKKETEKNMMYVHHPKTRIVKQYPIVLRSGTCGLLMRDHFAQTQLFLFSTSDTE